MALKQMPVTEGSRWVMVWGSLPVNALLLSWQTGGPLPERPLDLNTEKEQPGTVMHRLAQATESETDSVLAIRFPATFCPE